VDDRLIPHVCNFNYFSNFSHQKIELLVRPSNEKEKETGEYLIYSEKHDSDIKISGRFHQRP